MAAKRCATCWQRCSGRPLARVRGACPHLTQPGSTPAADCCAATFVVWYACHADQKPRPSCAHGGPGLVPPALPKCQACALLGRRASGRLTSWPCLSYSHMPLWLVSCALGGRTWTCTTSPRRGSSQSSTTRTACGCPTAGTDASLVWQHFVFPSSSLLTCLALREGRVSRPPLQGDRASAALPGCCVPPRPAAPACMHLHTPSFPAPAR